MIVNNDLISINEWQYFIEIMPMGIVNKMQINTIIDSFSSILGAKYKNNEIQYKYQIIEDSLHGYVLRLQVYIKSSVTIIPNSIYNIQSIGTFTIYPNLKLDDKCKFIDTSGVMLEDWNYIIKMPDNW